MPVAGEGGAGWKSVPVLSLTEGCSPVVDFLSFLNDATRCARFTLTTMEDLQSFAQRHTLSSAEKARIGRARAQSQTFSPSFAGGDGGASRSRQVAAAKHNSKQQLQARRAGGAASPSQSSIASSSPTSHVTEFRHTVTGVQGNEEYRAKKHSESAAARHAVALASPSSSSSLRGVDPEVLAGLQSTLGSQSGGLLTLTSSLDYGRGLSGSGKFAGSLNLDTGSLHEPSASGDTSASAKWQRASQSSAYSPQGAGNARSVAATVGTGRARRAPHSSHSYSLSLTSFSTLENLAPGVPQGRSANTRSLDSHRFSTSSTGSEAGSTGSSAACSARATKTRQPGPSAAALREFDCTSNTGLDLATTHSSSVDSRVSVSPRGSSAYFSGNAPANLSSLSLARGPHGTAHSDWLEDSMRVRSSGSERGSSTDSDHGSSAYVSPRHAVLGAGRSTLQRSADLPSTPTTDLLLHADLLDGLTPESSQTLMAVLQQSGDSYELRHSESGRSADGSPAAWPTAGLASAAAPGSRQAGAPPASHEAALLMSFAGSRAKAANWAKPSHPAQPSERRRFK